MRKMMLMLVLFCILTAAANAAVIAYWNMEEGAGETTKDHIGLSHDPVNGAAWISADLATVPSGSTAALDFSASTGNDAMGFAGVAGGAARTVSAWVKVNDGNATRNLIISWGSSYSNGVNGQRAEFLVNKNGAVRFEIGGGFTQGTTAVNNGQWHHVTYTSADSDTANVKIYVNGVEETVTFGNANPIDSIADFGSIGVMTAGSGATADRMMGLIDEVRVYDEVVDIATTLETITIPEPATMLLLCLGGGMTILRRRK